MCPANKLLACHAQSIYLYQVQGQHAQDLIRPEMPHGGAHCRSRRSGKLRHGSGPFLFIIAFVCC